MNDLDVFIETPCCEGCRKILEEFWTELKKQLNPFIPENVFLEVSVVEDEKVKSLNKTYRGKDAVTDVLSFEDGEKLPDGNIFLGSIVIACTRAKQQAIDVGNSFEEELRFLFLHGVLHLLGFDHEKDNGEMFKIQRDIKKRLKDFFSLSED